jgi:hypothetical protein
MMALGVVDVVEANAQRDGHVRLLGGRREDDFAGARVEMAGGVGARAEASARLDHDVGATSRHGSAPGSGSANTAISTPSTRIARRAPRPFRGKGP